MANLILSAFADEHSNAFENQVKYLANNNVDYIELRFVDGKNVSELTDNEITSAIRMLNEYGVGVSAIGSPLGKINVADDFCAHLDKTKRVCEIANKFGTKNIRMFSFYMPEGTTRDMCKNEITDRIGKMLDVSDEFGTTLCHENEAKIYGESPENCLELINSFNGRLKAVFDMGNFVLDGYNPFEAYNLLKNHIEYFHIKDALKKGAIVPPGKGEAQIQQILDAYKCEFSKDTFVTLEPHLQTFDGLNQLVGKVFDNPYKFETKEIAFDTALKSIKEILK